MSCLRCGAKVEEGRSFCSKCMGEMEKYPVKPGTPVQLPTRKNYNTSRRSTQKKRVMPKDKELITRLYRRNQLLTLLLLLTMLLLSFVTISYAKKVYTTPVKQPGQNWVVVETTAAP